MACPTSSSHPYAKAVYAKYQPIVTSMTSAGGDLCIDVTVAFKQRSLYSLQNDSRSPGPTCANSNGGHILPAIEFLGTA